MPELRGNHAIERAALDHVLDPEREAGRVPRRTGSPVDIESPPRAIEVKAVGKASCRGEDLWLEPAQVEALRDNPEGYLYIVENVKQGDPSLFTLRVLGGAQLQRLLANARERRYFTVAMPVSEYERLPARALTPTPTR